MGSTEGTRGGVGRCTLLLDFQGLGDTLGLGEGSWLLHPHFLGALALGWGGGLSCALPQAWGRKPRGRPAGQPPPLLR